MKVQFVFMFILFVSFIRSQSVYENIRIPKPLKSTYPFAQVEPSIAINPLNTNEIVVGTVLDDYYYSKDKGKSWNSKTLESNFGVNGDPVMLFDKHGNVYYFHLSNYKKGAYIDRIVCQKANKVDAKFSNGTFPLPNGKKAQDKHWVSYNYKKDEIYLTWTQFDEYGSKNSKDSSVILFSKSNDKGETWSHPIRISKHAGDCIDSDETVEGAVSTVGINDEIYVVWASKNGICFQKSLDAGKTWLEEEKIIQNLSGGWDLKIPGIGRCNGFPVLICDTSISKNRGRIYLNWSDQRNGENNTDVFLSFSDDGGDTWSEAKKVNQDDTKSHQFFSWMALDQSNGNLFFVFYDRRNYSDNQTDVYMSVSIDGGNEFEDTKISNSPFIPQEDVFFGDYINIAAVDGVIRPVWMRMDKGKISLWTALIGD